jgi:DNA-binding NtrC family response regulator
MKPNVAVVAIVGDQERYAAVLDWVRRRGMALEIATTGDSGLRLHREKGADLVLVGLPLPDRRAAALIASLQQQDARTTIVLVGKDEDVSSHLGAVELGAQEYIADPIDGHRDLLFALGVSLGVRRSDSHFRVLRAREAASADWRRVVANSPAMVDAMKRLRELCEWTVSGATPVVLFTGERGTGKHLLAKVLHYNGARRNRPFVEINCSALPPDVLRTELFGDAKAGRAGLLEIADGGTVFLQDIEAIPLGIQRDVLTAIEGRQMCRVGSEEPIFIDVQFAAGTRADLGAIVKRSEFRPDLYYRLSVRTIALPPLRDRGGDVIAIAERMLGELAAAHGLRAPQLHEDAVLALLRHAWPGNLHELHNELEHALLHAEDSVIRGANFHFRRGAGAVAVEASGRRLVSVSVTGDSCPLEQLEREVIRQALERCDGNVSRTARFLAITRQTLLYRTKKYGLRASPDPDPDD